MQKVWDFYLFTFFHHQFISSPWPKNWISNICSQFSIFTQMEERNCTVGPFFAFCCTAQVLTRINMGFVCKIAHPGYPCLQTLIVENKSYIRITHEIPLSVYQQNKCHNPTCVYNSCFPQLRFEDKDTQDVQFYIYKDQLWHFLRVLSSLHIFITWTCKPLFTFSKSRP